MGTKDTLTAAAIESYLPKEVPQMYDEPVSEKINLSLLFLNCSEGT